MAMQSALASLLMQPGGGGGGAPQGPPPNSLGVGPPPNMPGLPPSPQMVGQMPTGSTASNAKQAADVAISALTDAKGYFPNMGDSFDAMISQLQTAGAQQASSPAPQVGAPAGPGAAMPLSPPTADSGTAGPL